MFITADFNLESAKMFLRKFRNRTQNSSKNAKLFWRLRFERGSVVRPLSNGEGLRDMQHSINMVFKLLAVYYKMRLILLQNTTAILLQNATFIKNCDSTGTKSVCNSYDWETYPGSDTKNF